MAAGVVAHVRMPEMPWVRKVKKNASSSSSTSAEATSDTETPATAAGVGTVFGSPVLMVWPADRSSAAFSSVASAAAAAAASANSVAEEVNMYLPHVSCNVCFFLFELIIVF